MKDFQRFFGVALLLGAAATTAFAGGPNHMYDYATRTPYVWNIATWGGAVPVYTDLGNLKNSNPLVTNERADELTVAGLTQWSDVPTSTFQAQVAGDFALIGLPEINRTNANLVLGQFNGGGVHVLYDVDGRILQDYLGIFGALGVTGIEWVADDSPEILEAWVIINGSTVRSGDPNAVAFGGVFTHELGHVANLGHSNVNGAIFQSLDPIQPRDCGAPYSGSPTRNQVETMYPFLGTNNPTDTGAGMATVDRIDDIAAISDLYPAAGWPETYATIRGTVSNLRKIRGNGTGDAVELTGVNVIARNVADPFGDFSSSISGDETKGQVGPDGTFELHGLTPGAQYVLYVDALMSGAFSVPRPIALPGPEEYHNGVNESGNGETDDRCAWTTLTATPGTELVADITLNRVKGAPELTWLPLGLLAQNMTPDGSKIVGTAGEQYFVLDANTLEYQLIGGYAPVGGRVSISDDGTRIAGSYRDMALNQVFWGIYENGAWTTLPLRAGAVSPCPTGPTATWGSVFGISGDGQTVVGGTYSTGCSNGGFRATKWTPTTGSIALPKSPDSLNRASRANQANYDGSVITGWDDHTVGYRRGVYWTNGELHFVGGLGELEFIGESFDVTSDGSTIVGQQVGLDGIPGAPKAAWRLYAGNGQLDLLSDNTSPTYRRGAAWTISDDGAVVSGWNDLQFGRQATIWAEALGWAPFKEFLNSQGTFYEGSDIANAQSLGWNGQRMIGGSATIFGTATWILDMPKAVVCHLQGKKLQNLDVSFPDGLDDHLAHGDTVGLCQHGGE